VHIAADSSVSLELTSPRVVVDLTERDWKSLELAAGIAVAV